MSGDSRRRGRSCASYLARKVRERGWDGGSDRRFRSAGRPVRRARLCRRCGLCAGQVAVADRRAATASARVRPGASRRPALTRRMAPAAREHADGEAVRCRAAVRPAAADRTVRRCAHGDPPAAEKALAAMIRAGHGFALARAIVAARARERNSNLDQALRALSVTARKVGLPTLTYMLIGAIVHAHESAND